MLARQLGEQFFNRKLNQICTTWLKDPIFAVREASLINYKQLTVVFGEPWAQKNFLPPLLELQSEGSYLNRLTPLFGIQLCADIISAESNRKMVFPVLQNLAKDPVPNIRINVSKAIMALIPHIKDNKENIVSLKSQLTLSVQETCRQILNLMIRDTDTDAAYFSQKTIKML